MRFDWGPDGLAAVGAGAAVVVVVDVLRFTTAVSVAIGRGAVVLPYVWAAGDAAAAYARRHGAQLAGRREDGDWSLSPTDLAGAARGDAVWCCRRPTARRSRSARPTATPDATVLAGCLRNATAVARGRGGPRRPGGGRGRRRAVARRPRAGASRGRGSGGRRCGAPRRGRRPPGVWRRARVGSGGVARGGGGHRRVRGRRATTSARGWRPPRRGASSRSGAGPTTWSPRPPSTPSRRSPCSTVPASSPWVRGDPWPSTGPEPGPRELP